MDDIGRRRWAIAEGYIPSQSSFIDRALISHETACILNASDRDAHVTLTVFFANKEPVTYRVVVPARRTHHLRFNDLEDPPMPLDTDFSSVFESDVPIVVQHTRLDSRHAEVALLSTTAYAQG
jgi:hypothetical protein